LGRAASGQVIRSTAEHPFYAEGCGWVAAGDLRPGDQLVSHDGQRLAVAEVYDTGTYERVYNLAVAGFHTYFLCDATWPYFVWAHNNCGPGTLGKQQRLHQLMDDPNRPRHIRGWLKQEANAIA
jgi:hypothetical protein